MNTLRSKRAVAFLAVSFMIGGRGPDVNTSASQSAQPGAFNALSYYVCGHQDDWQTL